MTIRIGLLRHGRTAWNAEGRLQGQTDIPLEDVERERLAGLSLPPEWRGQPVLASTLSRARDTARLLTGAEPPTDARLVEMNFGHWEGRIGAELSEDHGSGFEDVEDWGLDYRPHNGESPRDLWARISAVLDGLTEDTLIVSHLGVMRSVLAQAHGWTYEGPMPFRIKRDRLYAVRRAEDGSLTPEPEPTRLVPKCA